MLEFLKKKKKDGDAEESSKKSEEKKDKKKVSKIPEKQGDGTSEKKTKKRIQIPKKIIFVAFLILTAIGASSFLVYRLYFAPKDPASLKAVYQKTELKHVNLPEEMIRFCFDHFPDLYAALLSCNAQITLMDKEIARIDGIAKKYPEQEKIAEKEKAVWEKAKINLQKGFLKIEKPVKEIYVLFRVNQEQAMIQINERNKELTELAGAALVPAQELTQTIRPEETPPQGLIKGTLYTLKKRFL
jgi:hypothetical protein